MNTKNLEAKSIHVFAWPFKFRNGKSGKQMYERIEKQGWIRKKMDLKDFTEEESFGQEYTDCFMRNQYFSLSARNIFCRGDKKDDQEIYKVYTYPMEPDADYTYYIKAYEGKEYSLPITSMELHMYQHGVGILFIQVANKDYTDIEDVKNISDYGRRTSLPFIPASEKDYLICARKLGIYVTCGQKRVGYITDFDAKLHDFFGGKQAELTGVVPFLYDIINVKVKAAGAGKDIGHSGSQDISKEEIEPTADDRMFVCTLIRDDELSKGIEEGRSGNEDTFEQLLYSVLYVDAGSASCQNKGMRRELLNKAIYPRWSDYGTLYGITGFSMICITSSYAGVTASVVKPFITEYTYMISLVLAQKIGIAHFSVEAGRIVKGAERKGLMKRSQANKLVELQEKYIVFKSQMLILEASCQEQGIDLYRLLQEQLLVNEEQHILDEQLESLYEVTNVSNGSRIETIGIAIAVIAILIDVVLNLTV